MNASGGVLLLLVIFEGGCIPQCRGFTYVGKYRQSIKKTSLHRIFAPSALETKIDQEDILEQLPTQEIFVPSSLESSRSHEDTLELYERDVAKVLKDLRGAEFDSFIPATFRNRRSSITNLWSLEMWDKHCSRWSKFDVMKFSFFWFIF